MADDTPEVERPEWLDSQFADAEAQAKAYSDARAEMSRAQSDVAQLRQDMERERTQFTEALTALSEQPAPPQQWNPQQDPTVAAYARAAEEGDAATMLAIQMQVQDARTAQLLDQRFKSLEEKLSPVQAADQEFALRMAEQQVAAEFGDRWPDVAAQINGELRGVLPSLAGQPVDAYVNAIRKEAQLADYKRLTTQQAAAEAERDAKLNAAAATMNSSTARIPTDTDAKKEEWQQVVGARAKTWDEVVNG